MDGDVEERLQEKVPVGDDQEEESQSHEGSPNLETYQEERSSRQLYEGNTDAESPEEPKGNPAFSEVLDEEDTRCRED